MNIQEPGHVMTREKAEQYRAEFKRATEKWSGQTFKHFADDAARERHLAGVKQDQDSGQVPF